MNNDNDHCTNVITVQMGDLRRNTVSAAAFPEKQRGMSEVDEYSMAQTLMSK